MTKIVKDNTIYKTEDYEIFQRIGGNRRLSKPHIKRLVNAFEIDPDACRYNPIIVSKDYEVVDGQHRLEALKELGLPVYFVQQDGLDLKTVQQLNANTKNWSPLDYARSYGELGNKNYVLYLDFKSKYKLNHDVLMKYLSLENAITGESFKNGKLKVSDVERSNELCGQLIDMGQYYERFNSRSFALGFLRIAQSENYDHNRMLSKFSTKQHLLGASALPEDFARQLEKIYNHGLHGDNKVRLF